MDINQVLQHFELGATWTFHTIYPYAPVYKVTLEDSTQLVLKQTCADLDEALVLAQFTRKLQSSGIDIVAPFPLPKNPICFPICFNNDLAESDDVDDSSVNEGNWILYPFIDGDKYQGAFEELFAAGKLLGKIHMQSSTDNQEGLTVYEEFDFTEEDISEDLETIHVQIIKHGINYPFKKLQAEMKKALKAQSMLSELLLPKVATPYDYKADNLIFCHQQSPYIIDPDNAAFLPRIFDLALALLLFHNVLASAPNRIFTNEEWQYFIKGYCSEVTLSDLEISHWQYAIPHLFLDEVLWLMADFDEGWENERQRALFESLLTFILDAEQRAQYDLSIHHKS